MEAGRTFEVDLSPICPSITPWILKYFRFHIISSKVLVITYCRYIYEWEYDWLEMRIIANCTRYGTRRREFPDFWLGKHDITTVVIAPLSPRVMEILDYISVDCLVADFEKLTRAYLASQRISEIYWMSTFSNFSISPTGRLFWYESNSGTSPVLVLDVGRTVAITPSLLCILLPIKWRLVKVRISSNSILHEPSLPVHLLFHQLRRATRIFLLRCKLYFRTMAAMFLLMLTN